MTTPTAIPRPRSLEIGGLDGLLYAGLFVVFAVSGFVMKEPAPYDGLLLALMAGSVVAGLRVPRALGPLFALIALVVAGEAIGATQGSDLAYSTKYTFVTLYLAASALFFACLAATGPKRLMAVLVPGMTLGALATAVAGIAGVLGFHPLAAELFTEFGRAKGGFKDANVMAPFLVLPIMFGIHRLMTRPVARAWLWLGWVGILVLAVFLSFSRGAWVHLVVSATAYMGIFILMAPSVAARARALVLGIFALVIAAASVGTALGVGKVGSMFEERATLTQTYDTDRFAGQRKAFALAAENPAGLGAGEFAFVIHGQDVHNVYLNAFVNGGWLGGFAYLGLIGATAFVGARAVFRRSEVQPILMPVFATFLGLALEGLVVDTDHWRHFYLIVGLVWGLAAYDRRSLPARHGNRTGQTRGPEMSTGLTP